MPSSSSRASTASCRFCGRPPTSTGTANPPSPCSATRSSARFCSARSGADLTDDLLRSGDYARKQIYCPSRVVAWSHGSRFELARKLAGTHKGGRLLDYGCGDGTCVAMVHREFGETVGVDVDPPQIAECVRRLGHLPGVRFGTVAETNAA